jgi:hypothetical protein
MSDLSIEYSLNTPVLSDKNILNCNLIELIKNNNMKGGSSYMDSSNNISLLIGIVIIIIGFVLLWFKNDWIETEAIIKTQTCLDSDKCKINITYIVDSIEYSKIITIEKNNIINIPKIKIYYQKINPKSIELYEPNYSITGISMIIIGALVMIFSIGNNNSFSNTESPVLSEIKTI